MKPFRFRLARVLEWRETELELAESRLRNHLAWLAELEQRSAALAAERLAAEADIRACRQVSGADLAALAAFCRHVDASRKQLAARRAEEERKLAALEAALLAARRRCRLLERLQQRRRAEWARAGAAEIERVAAESYLARWNERQFPAGKTRPDGSG